MDALTIAHIALVAMSITALVLLGALRQSHAKQCQCTAEHTECNASCGAVSEQAQQGDADDQRAENSSRPLRSEVDGDVR